MQYHWLNKQNNDKLIIFFGGWSFDYKPFEFLECDDYDVLMLYDYNNILSPRPLWEKIEFLDEQGEFRNSGEGCYKDINLIAWSMGVFVAYLLKDNLPKFRHKIAINGTPFPIHNEWGIPQKTFLLTLRHAKTGLEKKFYENIFINNEEYIRYIQNPVERSIENRADELKALYEKIKDTNCKYENFYDKAIISNQDKIIPTQNQINFWSNINTPYDTLESGHFPYYNFKSWKDILCK